MKAFVSKAGVGLLWFIGFTAVTNLVVRPLIQKATAAAGVPQIGNII